MSPFTALYYKEFREHRVSLFVMLGLLVLCHLPLFLGGKPDGVLIWYFYLYAFYVTAIAAMSYAKEEESKASRFLRTLPVSSGTIFLAKLAWLGTVMLALALPGFYLFCLPAIWTEGVAIGFYQAIYTLTHRLGIPVLWSVVTIFSLVSWGYFWSTRYPSKLFATLLSCCCVFITWLLVGWLALQMAMLFDDGRPGMKFHLFLAGGVFFIGGLYPAVFGGWRAATFYSRTEPETKPEAFLNSERKDNDRRVRLVTRLFPRERWTPFQALLWQAICQSRDILFFGLGTAICFSLWQVFCSGHFFDVLDQTSFFGKDALLRDQLTVLFGFGVMSLGFLIAFGLGSSMFAQDHERDLYRALGQRGISPRLVWWSRVLPFLAVILLPTPFISMHIVNTITINLSTLEPTDRYFTVAAFTFFLYLAPFGFGTFYSMLFRNVLVCILMTVGTGILFLCSIIRVSGCFIRICL